MPTPGPLPSPTAFGRLLSEQMTKHNVSTRGLAAVLGVSHTFIHMVLSGQRRSIVATRWPALLSAFPGLTENDLLRATRQSGRSASFFDPLGSLDGDALLAVERMVAAIESGRRLPKDLVHQILRWADEADGN